MALPKQLIYHWNRCLWKNERLANSTTRNYTKDEIDHKLWNDHVFQEAVTELFRSIYPSNTMEDAMVRRIMCILPCRNDFLIRQSRFRPDGNDRYRVPLICTVFYQEREQDDMVVDEIDRELKTLRRRLQDEFCHLIYILDLTGQDATFQDLTPELKADFVSAARLFARRAAMYNTRKSNTVIEEMQMVLDLIPHIRSRVCPADPSSVLTWFNLCCDFYVRFERPLTAQVANAVGTNLITSPNDVFNLDPRMFQE